MIADEHTDFRAGLADIVRRDLGFLDVVETGSLDEAIQHLCESDVSFASFDLHLPGMRGFATLHGVRHALPAVRLAVVAASARRSDMLLALDAGVHGYVPKTFGFGDIALALRMVIDGQVFVPWSIADLAVDDGDGAAIEPGRLPVSSPVELTFDQLQVLHLLAGGRSRKAIGRALSFGDCNVAVHLNALFKGLGVKDRHSANRTVVALGLGRTR